MVEDGDAEEREAEQDEVDGDAGKVQRLDRCSVSEGRSQQREHARGADANCETAMPSPEGVHQPMARPCQEVAVDASLPGTHAILSGSTVVSPGPDACGEGALGHAAPLAGVGSHVTLTKLCI